MKECERCEGTGMVMVGSPGRYNMTTCGKCNGKGKGVWNYKNNELEG